jgi:hypothetical protein
MLTTALGSILVAVAAGGIATADDPHNSGGPATATPIKHVIILIAENRTFDNIFGMYRPKHGQSVSNLLSKGIVNSSGMTVLNTPAQQSFIQQPYPPTYFIDFHATAGRTPYPILPQPNTAYIPPNPGPLSDGQAPFDSADVPDALLPALEPSFEKQYLGCCEPAQAACRCLRKTRESPTPATCRTASSRSPERACHTTAIPATWCIGCSICGSNPIAASPMRLRIIPPAA